MYRQLAARLRARIADGEFPPGRRIPSLRDLEAEYQVAPMTVRKAVGLLVDEGLVITKPGRGTFVAG